MKLTKEHIQARIDHVDRMSCMIYKSITARHGLCYLHRQIVLSSQIDTKDYMNMMGIKIRYNTDATVLPMFIEKYKPLCIDQTLFFTDRGFWWGFHSSNPTWSEWYTPRINKVKQDLLNQLEQLL